MIVTGAVTWAVFFIFRFLGAPSRLYWQERNARTVAEGQSTAGSLEILYDPADKRYVQQLPSLHGPRGEFYSIGISNRGNRTLYDVTVRALDSAFTEAVIVPAQTRRTQRGHLPHNPITVFHRDALHPHAPEITQLFGFEYNAGTSHPDDISNSVQRFTLEMTARDTPALRREFEYDPNARPMIKIMP